MSVERILKGHDLFGLLSVEEMNLVSGFSTEKKFGAGESVYSCNGRANHVYMMMEGTVHLRLPSEDPQVSFLVSQLERGELFGLAPMLEAERYTTTAHCATDVRVLSIEAEPFLKLLERDYTAGYQIMRRAARIYYTRYIEILKTLQGVLKQIPLVR